MEKYTFTNRGKKREKNMFKCQENLWKPSGWDDSPGQKYTSLHEKWTSTPSHLLSITYSLEYLHYTHVRYLKEEEEHLIWQYKFLKLNILQEKALQQYSTWTSPCAFLFCVFCCHTDFFFSFSLARRTDVLHLMIFIESLFIIFLILKYCHVSFYCSCL